MTDAAAALLTVVAMYLKLLIFCLAVIEAYGQVLLCPPRGEQQQLLMERASPILTNIITSWKQRRGRLDAVGSGGSSGGGGS